MWGAPQLKVFGLLPPEKPIPAQVFLMNLKRGQSSSSCLRHLAPDAKRQAHLPARTRVRRQRAASPRGAHSAALSGGPW